MPDPSPGISIAESTMHSGSGASRLCVPKLEDPMSAHIPIIYNMFSKRRQTGTQHFTDRRQAVDRIVSVA